MRLYDSGTGLYYEVVSGENDHAVIVDADNKVIDAHIPDKNEHTVIVDADNKITEVHIPDEIDGHMVTKIGKKAFLGKKLLRSVYVGKNVSVIGEWAFAYCDNLRTIDCAASDISIGQGVFKGDKRINNIKPGHADEKTGRLMAAAAIVMEADYLLEMKEAGSNEWYEKWDHKLADMLNTKDDDGYHLYVLCGEEDLHFDYEEYIEYIREQKSGLCLERLINDRLLSSDFRELITNYVLNMAAGCDCDAAWKYVLNNHGDDIEYYECMIKIGAVNSHNLERALEDMGMRHAEMKSYLLKEIQGYVKTEEKDFFSMFEI